MNHMKISWLTQWGKRVIERLEEPSEANKQSNNTVRLFLVGMLAWCT